MILIKSVRPNLTCPSVIITTMAGLLNDIVLAFWTIRGLTILESRTLPSLVRPQK